MILSSGTASTLAGGWPGVLATILYAVAALRGNRVERWSAMALPAAWAMHLVALVVHILGWGQDQGTARLGFAPVLSLTVWIVIGLHAIESRFVPLPTVRSWLAPVGALVVVLASFFPGESRPFTSGLGPLHFVLGVGAYGLFGAAVLHGALLDSAERRLRMKGSKAANGSGMPLLQLERLTFRFVQVGFVVLSGALLLGMVTTQHWRWDHKTVLSLLGWVVFAALLIGRHVRGWRGRLATRWLYGGALLLLLAYAGSRFVLEVLLERATT